MQPGSEMLRLLTRDNQRLLRRSRKIHWHEDFSDADVRCTSGFPGPPTVSSAAIVWRCLH